MPCPHLKEVVMLYCDAYPVKKMVPLDKLVSANPCIAEDYRDCPLFRQAAGASGPAGESACPGASRDHAVNAGEEERPNPLGRSGREARQ